MLLKLKLNRKGNIYTLSPPHSPNFKFYPDSNLGKDFVLVLKRFSLHEWQRAKSLQDFKCSPTKKPRNLSPVRQMFYVEN